MPSALLLAQKGSYNYQGFAKKPYYFGITLGSNRSDYKVYRSKNFNIDNDSIAGIESAKGPGFNLQVVSNLCVGEYFDVRFLPGFSFAERDLVYDPKKRNAKNYLNKIESVLVELPFQLRYKSAPFNDKRAYVLAGFKYAYDIQSKSRSRQLNDKVKISPIDFTAEYGVGMQIYFPYFVLSPEFKVSQGLNNLLIFNGNRAETSVLEKVRSRTFTISFHFEG